MKAYAGQPSGRDGSQRGFALLELAIAVAIGCLLAVWAADRLLHQVDDAAERAAGLWMADIKRALDGMLARHGDTLGAGATPLDEHGRPVYADPWSPTLAELKAQGHLAAATVEPGPLGLTAIIRLWRDDRCPGAACRIDALAHSGRPVLRPASARPDFARIAGILMAAAGAGGSVSELAPGRVRGAAFDLPNPPAPGMPALPAGTVAVHAWRQADSARAYLRPLDPRNPDFRGDVSAAGSVSASGRVVAGEHLKLGATAASGDACPENGLLAREADGSLLSCVNGAWAAPGGFGGAFSYNTISGCLAGEQSSPNPLTGLCACPAGFRAVLVSGGGRRGDYVEHGWTEGYVCVR